MSLVAQKINISSSIWLTDPLATAADSGVDVTSSIVTTGTVDTATLGTYTRTYTYTDAGELYATQVRTVVVVPASLGIMGTGTYNLPSIHSQTLSELVFVFNQKTVQKLINCASNDTC